MLAQATLFYLPTDAQLDALDIRCRSNVIAPTQQWMTNGVMPYPVTATETSFIATSKDFIETSSGNTYSFNHTCVFQINPTGDLTFIVKAVIDDVEEGCGRQRRQITYVAAMLTLDGQLRFPALLDGSVARDVGLDVVEDYRVRTSGSCGLQSINWLVEALGSIERSAFQREPLTRQVSRATGYPRQSWEITIRRKGTRGVPTNREIFAAVMKAAHAVRAHMRTNYRTGDKDIKVKAHIRGHGDGVQIKDYRVAEKS
jgi:hypothetical protein